jgi:hypothetical protein
VSIVASNCLSFPFYSSHSVCPRRMRTSQRIAFTVLDGYDVLYTGERTDAGVGSGRLVRLCVFVWISLLLIDLKPVRNCSARFRRILARKDGALNIRDTLRMRFCASYISSFKKRFSLRGCIMLSFGRISVSMGVVRHPASYPMGTRGSFPGGKAAGSWSWPLTSIYCRGQECLELYLHSLIRPHDVVLS